MDLRIGPIRLRRPLPPHLDTSRNTLNHPVRGVRRTWRDPVTSNDLVKGLGRLIEISSYSLAILTLHFDVIGPWFYERNLHARKFRGIGKRPIDVRVSPPIHPGPK